MKTNEFCAKEEKEEIVSGLNKQMNTNKLCIIDVVLHFFEPYLMRTFSHSRVQGFVLFCNNTLSVRCALVFLSYVLEFVEMIATATSTERRAQLCFCFVFHPDDFSQLAIPCGRWLVIPSPLWEPRW